MFVFTIDQRKSRSSSDRVPLFLKQLNQQLAQQLVLPFERTVGDEIQGVAESPETVIKVAESVIRSKNWYLGIGVGEVEKPLPESSRVGRGSAFVAAREAVEKAKKSEPPLVLIGASLFRVPLIRDFASGDTADDEALVNMPADSGAQYQSDSKLKQVSSKLVREHSMVQECNSLIRLLAAVWSKRSDQGWQAIDAVRSGEISQSQAAERLGISPQALSLRLKAALWEVEQACLPLLIRLLTEVQR